MRNFVFHIPTKIIFGRDTIPKIGEETAVYGNRILLVYGRNSSKRNGVFEQVMESCRAAGLTVTEHGGVKSNPVLSHVREGIVKARVNKVEAVLAVGGGSVLDSAKAIAAGVPAEHDVWKFFRAKKGIRRVLPMTCVSTMAASGSEMNGGMVLTNEDTKEKFGVGNQLLRPRVAILDPVSTFSVPPDYTAYGAADAISHLLEFYFTASDPQTPVQDRLMEGLLINIMAACNRVLPDPHNYRARAELMWCAALALNGLTAAGLGMVGFPMHMIEHSLSAIYDVPHGAGLSVVVPAWMTYQAKKSPRKFARFASMVFQVNENREEEMAAEGIRRLTSWFVKVKCPTTLAALGIPEKDIPLIAENALRLAKIWRLREYSREMIEEILRLGK